jgi:hypothetical protein
VAVYRVSQLVHEERKVRRPLNEVHTQRGKFKAVIVSLQKSDVTNLLCSCGVTGRPSFFLCGASVIPLVRFLEFPRPRNKLDQSCCAPGPKRDHKQYQNIRQQQDAEVHLSGRARATWESLEPPMITLRSAATEGEVNIAALCRLVKAPVQGEIATTLHALQCTTHKFKCEKSLWQAPCAWLPYTSVVWSFTYRLSVCDGFCPCPFGATDNAERLCKPRYWGTMIWQVHV